MEYSAEELGTRHNYTAMHPQHNHPHLHHHHQHVNNDDDHEVSHYLNNLLLTNSSIITNASPGPACVGLDCYPEAVFYAVEIVTVVLALGGFLGNGLTVLAILSSSLRSNLNSILIGNLSVACVLYCCLVLPLQAVAFHHREWALPQELCVGVAAIRIWLIGVNMSLLSAIAFYRFIHVVHPHAYSKLSEGRYFFPVIALCWMFAAFFSAAPILGWGSYRFELAILQCTFDSMMVDKSHKITVVTIGYVIPCVFISVCYFRIGCVVYKSRKRALRTSVRKKSQRGSLRLTAMMLFIFLGFFVGTTPYFIINIVDPKQRKPMAHIWAPCAAWLLYCLNPVIYTVMDNNFQQAYRQLVCCLLCRQDAARMQKGSLRSKASKPPSPSLIRE